jgi:uncharacterized protein
MARMLVDEIKGHITAAMKSGDKVARDVLRLALGEIQTAEARANAPVADADAAAALRKLIKSNEETLAAIGEDPRSVTLRREIEVLKELLPAQMSVEQIVGALAEQQGAIREAKSDGQATGTAMKHLKSVGAAVDGNDVAAAVRQIRGG